MVDTEVVLNSIAAPMQRYMEKMTRSLIDDLSLTGKKASFDLLYEKIGTQFLIFETAKHHLEQFFSLVHVCDREVVTAINSPVTTFTLAVK